MLFINYKDILSNKNSYFDKLVQSNLFDIIKSRFPKTQNYINVNQNIETIVGTYEGSEFPYYIILLSKPFYTNNIATLINIERNKNLPDKKYSNADEINEIYEYLMKNYLITTLGTK